MFKNEYFIVFIMFCLLFLTIPHLSAVEDLNITSSIDGAVLEDSDKGNFNDLNNLIKTNDEIELDRDYFYNISVDSSFKRGIDINKTLTIDGHGHTIDANNNARIFNVNHNNVVLKNIKFMNGNNDIGGGAIYFSSYCSYCSIVNSTFTNNIASESCGGAIYYHYCYDCSIINSTFLNNKATKYHSGGAIYYATVYNCFIANSTFTNNIANSGGAIYYSDGSDCLIENSTFTNNTQNIIEFDSNEGIYTVDYNYYNMYDVTLYFSEVTIKNCTFIDSSLIIITEETDDEIIKPNIISKKTTTFKAKKKIKRYSITLKAGKTPVKKVKVYLKINKKTIPATTNNKGKATFKIKKLKKRRTYTAKIIFKGNDNYGSATKTVKIKVKK